MGFLGGVVKGAADESKKKYDDSGEDENGKKQKKSLSFRKMSFKRGGKVKRTGMAKVHKGERVLTKKQDKRYSARKRS